MKKVVLKRKTVSLIIIGILLPVIIFSVWSVVGRHKARAAARKVHYNFAVVLKEKAKIYAEKEEKQLAVLFALNSMLYQAKAQRYLSMKDIPLPVEISERLSKFPANYSEKNIEQLLKTVETQTGLVLDGGTPVEAHIYYSLDLEYYKNSKYGNALDAYKAAENYYTSGSNYLKNREYNKAVTAFNKALKIRPGFTQALNELGWAYYLKGDKGTSETFFEKVKEWDPAYYRRWNPGKWNDLGNAQSRRGNFEKAVNAYRRAIRIDPRNYPAWTNLCRAYIKNEKYGQAVDAFLELEAIKPEDPSVFHDIENTVLKKKKYDNLIAFYGVLLEKKPDYSDAWNRIGEIYRTFKEDYPKAIKAFRKVLEINPGSKEALNALGWCYYITGDIEASGQIYKRASRLDSGYFREWNAGAWADLGSAYEEKKEYAKAIDAYNKAIRIEPGYYPSWKKLADLYRYKKNDPARAIDTCKRAIKTDRRNHRGWYNLGEIYFDNGEFDKAIYSFKQALKIEPGAYDAWAGLGRVYWNKGELVNAVRNFKKAVEINAGLWDTWRSLGTIYLERKQFDEAVIAFKAMTGIEGGRAGMQTAVSWLFLGDAYYKIRAYQKAIGAYKQAIKISPDFFLPRENIIRIYINTKEPGKAVQAFLQLKKIKKHLPFGLDEIDKLFIKQEAYDQAVTFYKILLEKTADDYRAWCKLGNIYSLYKKDYREAILAFYNALKIREDAKCALDGLGWTYHLIGHYRKSIDVYKKAIEQAPAWSMEWKSKISYNLAVERSVDGQYDGAIDAFITSVELYPQFDQAWLRLAEEYQAKNKGTVTYKGEPWDLYFHNADLRRVLIFFARQTGLNLVIDREVKGKITCQLDRFKWDKALDLFLKINDCDMCSVGNILRVGNTEIIKTYSKNRRVKDIKTFTGESLDLSFTGDDINFVLQALAARLRLKIVVDPGINRHITCQLYQVPWDLALDVLMEENHLACFRIGSLLRIGKKAVIKKMSDSQEGLLDILRSLLELDPRQVNYKDANEKTLLFTAAKKGYAKLVRYLISMGADVRARDRWRFTPLHDAGTREVARILIANGADLHARSRTGATPLQTAAFGLRTDVARYLANRGAKTDIFLDAAMGRIMQVRETIGKYPWLVNKAEADGWTPLHHAAAAGRYKTSAFLISRGANINAVSQKGETPLHAAVSRGNERMVKLLIMKGAHVNPRNNYGHTPFKIAKNNGNKKIAMFLQRHGGHE